MTDKEESKSQTQARQERLRSGAYGTHGDRRTKRNRTRSSQNKNAIRESKEED